MDITKYLECNLEGRSQLRKEGDGNAYIIIDPVRTKNKSRYVLFVNEKGGIIYDRVTSKKSALPEGITGLPEYSKAVKSTELISTLEPLFNKGKVVTDHPYLKGLHDLILDTSAYREIDNKIVSFYTSFYDYPFYKGAKTYPDKRSKKGSIMKGSYCVHSYDRSNTQWAIGEGLKECVLAANILKDHNVLESGGVGNTNNILETLPATHTALLLGENDSIDAYTAIIEASGDKLSTNAVFPKKKYKDFADQYIAEKKLSDIHTALTVKDIQDKKTLYVHLGVAGKYFYLYSKLESSVWSLTTADVTDTLNIIYSDANWLDLIPKRKDQVKKTIMVRNAGRHKRYTPNNQYGVGLWKKDKNLLYNTGEHLYLIRGKTLTKVNYSEYVQNDFLITRQDTAQGLLPKPVFNPIPLRDAILSCDWVHPSHGKILIGFLMQSFYAGAVEFSPNLWLESSGSSAGKTWLTTWLKTNLTVSAMSAESGNTTASGISQTMADYATLIFIDEFGESTVKDTKNTEAILVALRSSCSGQGVVLKGTPNQKAITLRVRMSALVSCINASSSIEDQDYQRFLFIKLNAIASKDHFYEKIEPAFAKVRNPENFLAYSLSRYNMYMRFLPVMIAEAGKNLYGHKIRGVASAMAGYAAYMGDIQAGKDLYKEILTEPKSKQVERFKTKEETDGLLKCLSYSYASPYSTSETTVLKSIYEGIATDPSMSSWGLKLSRDKKELYIHPASLLKALQYLKINRYRDMSVSGFKYSIVASSFLKTNKLKYVRYEQTVRYCMAFDYVKIDEILGCKNETEIIETLDVKPKYNMY